MSSSGVARPTNLSKAPRFMATITRHHVSGSRSGCARVSTCCSKSIGKARVRSRRQFAHAIGIFILPPSIDALEARLKKRGQDSPAVIARRLAAARSEIQHAPEFDFIVINEDFDAGAVAIGRDRDRRRGSGTARKWSAIGHYLSN